MATSISSIPATDTSTTTSSSSTTSLASTTMGQEDFLTLLCTQLQYQNPLDPQDPGEFVAQLAQFSSLEQLINVNDKLDEFTTTLASVQTTNQMGQALSLLGKTIKAQGNIFQVSSGEAADVSCVLGADASKVTVSVYNSSGTLVRTLDLGSQSSGECDISWDGKDSNGNQVADGTYYYEVSAVDSDGNSVSTATLVTGTVDEVLQDSGTVYLKVNGRVIALDKVITVEEAS
ncbi:MAG: flagellar hook assembly protein FlgD [Thermodesulfobacteriota bacterium]